MVYSSDLYPAHRSTGNPDNPFERETIYSFDIRLTNGDEYRIDKHFFTDLATVPRFLWGVISPWGRDELAFIVHDWLLEYKKKDYSKKFIDQQMYEFQKLVGVGPLRAKIMYEGVRKFGGIYHYFFESGGLKK